MRSSRLAWPLDPRGGGMLMTAGKHHDGQGYNLLLQAMECTTQSASSSSCATCVVLWRREYQRRA